MSFLTTLGLLVGLLVIAPYLAHRLRRRRAEEQPFPPARLVAPSQPKARTRSRLEHLPLLAARILSVLALAILGGTLFVRCSRLSVKRVGGASVAIAIVLDDSMSMRADAGGRSRFDRARDGARDILSMVREGDAVAVVMAGAPARVALAATTDLAGARSVINTLAVSDRATDLEGAVVLASNLIASLPQIDRRIALLSDLADGKVDAPPLGESLHVPLWIPLPELRGAKADCAVLSADAKGAKVRVKVACGPDQTAVGRDVVLEDSSGKVLGRAPVTSGPEADLAITLAESVARPDRAVLSGSDAVAADDSAPVATDEVRGTIALAADPADELVATGGAPIVQQAFAALKLDVELSLIPSVPERIEDLARDLGVVMDDPPGFTPEQRRALAAFVQGGGVVLLALGPHAAAAPLGANFEPFLASSVTWADTSAAGAEVEGTAGPLSGRVSSWDHLEAPQRAILAAEDIGAINPFVRWSDGAPLVARRAIGRGEAWLLTLPFSAEASDLPLRPAFLEVLDAWVRVARDRVTPRRSEVGNVWTFPGADRVVIQGPSGALSADRSDGVLRATPPLLGAYKCSIDGKVETRIAAPSVRELDLRARLVSTSVARVGPDAGQGFVDASPQVAIGLLALMALELALRIAFRRRASARGRGEGHIDGRFSGETKACDPAA